MKNPNNVSNDQLKITISTTEEIGYLQNNSFIKYVRILPHCFILSYYYG